MLEIFSQVTPPPTVPWAGPASALGTAGVLVYLIFYFLTKHIPDIESRHREERNELHRDLMDIHSEHMAKLNEMSHALHAIEEHTRPLRAMWKERQKDDDGE